MPTVRGLKNKQVPRYGTGYHLSYYKFHDKIHPMFLLTFFKEDSDYQHDKVPTDPSRFDTVRTCTLHKIGYGTSTVRYLPTYSHFYLGTCALILVLYIIGTVPPPTVLYGTVPVYIRKYWHYCTCTVDKIGTVPTYLGTGTYGTYLSNVSKVGRFQ